ncbi:MAG TPA: hypothetical protein PKO06_11665 [Candidatus Ozemobacteraceae bacterium]|nr:hypothetical protein [Candidatus Ozemobacteraceae bacterium]
MKRLVLLAGAIYGFAAMFAFSVNADSTLTIPIPDKSMSSKEVTLSLRIPPNTQPITQQARPKMVSRSALYSWDANPLPKVANTDELRDILLKFVDKGWLKGISSITYLKTKQLDKYISVSMLQKTIDAVLEIAQSPNMVRTIRKSNLLASDIEDLRRMMARYTSELKMFGTNVAKTDKDLLMLQEQYKTAKSGIMKVIKVEGMGDGSTVIHLNVE